MAGMIIGATTNLFRTYLISRFIQVFLGESKIEKSKQIIAYVAFSLINTSLYLMFYTAWINILCNLVGICLLVWMYTKSVKTILFVSCSICLINAGCDVFCVLLFISYEDGKATDVVYEVATVFLILICQLITERIVKYRKNASELQNFPLVLVPLCSIAILDFMLYETDSTRKGNIILSFGLLIINFLVLYLYNQMLKSLSQKYENEILKHKIKIYYNQLETALYSEKQVKALRHDMKHHMNELKLMAIKYGIVEIQNYINSMEEFIQNPNEIVSSGNTEIDSVLNYMLQRAKEELCTVNIKVQIPEAVSHSFDINVILGNLLENAIEAASMTEEKYLDLYMQLKKGVLKIKVENSFIGKIAFHSDGASREKHLATTKKDKDQHGIGLSNVKKIVEKYNGVMDINSVDNRFSIKLILYMSYGKD